MSDSASEQESGRDFEIDLEERLTEQNLMRSLRPVDLSERGAAEGESEEPADISEADTISRPGRGQPDMEDQVTRPSARPPASAGGAPGPGKHQTEVMDSSQLHQAHAEKPKEWDPWQEALPRHMGNWQELTLLPLPDDPAGVIGAGGQATIYSYVQRELGRGVAVKALRPESRSYDSIEDLVREACITARLEHPNIVPVHYLHLPEHNHDAPYWVMKRIHGKALTAHLPGQEDPWPTDRLLDVFQRIMDAVAFAHSKGIVHRDLKPDNVLVGEFGEVQVTDWGLAVAITDEGAHGAKPVLEADAAAVKEGTAGADESRAGAARASGSAPLSDEIAKLNEEVRSGSLGALLKSSAGGCAGTPAYMAPEQLDLSADNIDERTDVFLLGGVLYAMLTGTPPHELRKDGEALTARDMHTAIRSCSTIVSPENRREAKARPTCVEGLSPIASESLSAIVMKALSPEPVDRFENVAALSAALEEWESRSASQELCAQADTRLGEVKSQRRADAHGYAQVVALAEASLGKWPGNEEAQRIRVEASTGLAAIQRRATWRFWTAAAATVLLIAASAVGYLQSIKTWQEQCRIEHLEAYEVGERKRYATKAKAASVRGHRAAREFCAAFREARDRFPEQSELAAQLLVRIAASAASAGDYLAYHVRCLANEEREGDDCAEAQRLYTLAIALDPNSVTTYLDFADMMKAEGQLDEAARQYRRSVEVGAVTKARTRLLAALRSLEEHDQAAEVLLPLSGDETPASRQQEAGELAAALVGDVQGLRQGDRSEWHERACRLAVKLDPNNAAVQRKAAAALRKLRLYDDAVRCCTKALELEPNSSQSKAALASILNSYAWDLLTREGATEAHEKRALPMAERAAKLSQRKQAYILDTLALAYSKTGSVSQAITTQEEAIALLEGGEKHKDYAKYTKRLAEFRAAAQKAAPK